MYKRIDFEDYSLQLEVGVIPSDDTSSFLSKLSVSGGIISQSDYEKFLVSSLVKDSTQLKAVLEKLSNQRDKDIFNGQLVETIYKINHRLRPQHLVIVGEKVMDQSDALRKNMPISVTLPANPGWTASVAMSNLFDPGPAQTVINQAWEDIKRKFPKRNYIKKHISALNLEVPILQIESVNITSDKVVQDYVERRCENDIEMAMSNMLQWKAHVITQTIPRITELYTALAEGNYINVYSETIVLTQLYLAIVEVNPMLDWSQIDWTAFKDRKGDYGAKILKGKKLPGRSKSPFVGKSSKAEIEAGRKRFTSLAAQTILELKDKIKGIRIVGQDHAIDAVVDAIAVARVGLRGEEKPIGSWLLPGPTGVGKTEFAKVLADELGVELVRVDCSEYQHAHEISKLFGAPPGYVGFEDARQESGPPMTLASKVKTNPFCVVLFDELEKADKAIFNVLLQIMDDGVVTSGRGESIKFNEAIILMTSNIGSKEAQEACNRTPIGIRNDCEDKNKLKAEVIDATIKELFSPEFLNRLTGIIQFNSLDRTVCRSITDVMLSKTRANLEKSQHMSMSWDDSVKDFLLDEGYSEEYGARNIGRALQKKLELPLAEWILKNKYLLSDDSVKDDRPDLVEIMVENGEFKFKEAKCDNGTEENNSNKEGVCNTGNSGKRRRTPNGKASRE